MPDRDTFKNRRCANHATREAVARCPACKKDLCRECITEHKGKMLCTDCLKSTTAKKEAERKKLEFALLGLLFVAGMIVSFYFFFGIASILEKIPDKFHDASRS